MCYIQDAIKKLRILSLKSSRFSEIFKILCFLRVVPVDDIPTFCMSVNKGFLEMQYSTEFIQKIETDLYGNKRDVLDTLVIVLMHELLHINKGHLKQICRDIKNNIFPTLTNKDLNIAMDLQVNSILYTTRFDASMLSINSLNYFFSLVFVPQSSNFKHILDTHILKKMPNIHILARSPQSFIFWLYILKMIQGQHLGSKIMFTEITDKISNFSENVQSSDSAIKNDLKNTTNIFSKVEYFSKNEEESTYKFIPEDTGQKIYSLEDLLQFYGRLNKKYGSCKDYFTPHTLNRSKILDNRFKLPVPRHTKKIKTMFFIDTSSSMSYEKLKHCYSVIEPIVHKLGKIEYVSVSQCLKERGIVKHSGFIDALDVGGGTYFRDVVYDLFNEGQTHFLFYTDGKFDNFDLPPNMIKNEQVWILVGANKNFNMPGVKLFL